MHVTDRLENWAWSEYRDEEPGDTVLNWRVNGVLFALTTLEPQIAGYGFNLNGNAQLASYWNFFAGTNVLAGGWDPMELRGGPALRYDPRVAANMGFSSDSRKHVRFEVNVNGARNWVADSMQFGVNVGATIQARSNIDIFVGPSWFERTDPMQYVTEIADMSGAPHYLFGRIRQTTAALTTRVNWTFSPRLSLQIYAQPFIAAGSYSEYKDVDNPHADRFEDRFVELDGTEYMFERPDFDFGQLRSTVVLRWEYRPGSTVFAIWSHGRTNDVETRFDLGSDLASLARAPGESIVMVKANYWIGL
jgi:hypothetical protein